MWFERRSGTAIFRTSCAGPFAELDAERRRVIGEADRINQQRNAASKEIGALMQAGKKRRGRGEKSRGRGSEGKSGGA